MKLKLYIIAVSLIAGAPVMDAETNAITLRLDDEIRATLREATADHWFKRDAFFSTVLGGFLAALGGFGASGIADWLQARRKRKDDAEFADNALRAIHRELQAVSEVYDAGIGKLLKETSPGEPFIYSLGMTQDFFTVFNANSAHLGKIDADVSRRIITVYVRMKQLIEQFKINNAHIEEAEHLAIEAQNLQTQKEYMMRATQLVSRETQLRKQQVASSALLKQIDEQLKKETQELFAVLAARGIN